MATLTASIGRTPYETHLSTASQVIVADEPVDMGGQDRGMRPGELLAASLGACTVMTLRMYADRKGWPLDSVVVHVDYTNDIDTKRSLFVVKLILNGSLTEDQRVRLTEMADRCPIHRALQNPVDFETILIDDAGSKHRLPVESNR